LNKRKIFIIILCIGIFSYFCTGLKDEQPAEDLEIVAGVGVDSQGKGETDTIFVAPSSVYIFEEDEKISSSLRTGIGKTPADTREDRQLTSNKQYILGLEKIYLISESMCISGLTNPIEILFRNSNTNDNSYVAICKKKPEEIFKLKIQGYPSSADYLEGMLKNAKSYNFFSTHYKISDIFLDLDDEGKNIIIPSIDEVNNELKITGLCLFKKDKLIGNLDIGDSKALNMLSDTDGKGIVSLILSPDKHLDYYATVKRRVKAYKLGNNYKYSIDLKFVGDIISNSIYNKLQSKATINNEVETALEKSIKEYCQHFIDKLKHQYKVDALSLGEYAVAKYGRGKSIDWDEVFTNADIEINVKAQMDRTGRGEYFLEK
jgi:Ger(x)C family germination protein